MERDAIETMEKKIYLSWLLAFYGEMLTENQREMARLHWEEDYSLAEIAACYTSGASWRKDWMVIGISP